MIRIAQRADLDLLGFGDSDPELTLKIFREIGAIKADDAVVFDSDGLIVDRVRDESGYGGLRLKTYATVDGARVRVVIDIGYGDATEPGLNDIELPVLLDQPAPNLKAYPYETVISEKFQAMVALGLANSRLKDFYDIWILAQTYGFKDDRLAQAIAATFARRKTEIPTERPDGLTSAFASDPTKQQQSAAFVQEVAVNPGELSNAVRKNLTCWQEAMLKAAEADPKLRSEETRACESGLEDAENLAREYAPDVEHHVEPNVVRDAPDYVSQAEVDGRASATYILRLELGREPSGQEVVEYLRTQASEKEAIEKET